MSHSLFLVNSWEVALQLLAWNFAHLCPLNPPVWNYTQNLMNNLCVPHADPNDLSCFGDFCCLLRIFCYGMLFFTLVGPYVLSRYCTLYRFYQKLFISDVKLNETLICCQLTLTSFCWHETNQEAGKLIDLISFFNKLYIFVNNSHFAFDKFLLKSLPVITILWYLDALRLKVILPCSCLQFHIL